MGAGAHDTEYGSRRLEGRVQESDWHRRNSRLTDVLPGMEFYQHPLHVDTALHCGPNHDFTQNAPQWDPVFGNLGVVLEEEAFFNGMTEYLPQAHAPMHSPVMYQCSSAHSHWSEVVSSQSTGLLAYPPARTQRFSPGIAPLGKRSALIIAAAFMN
jgi:hypothetical protein